MRSLLAIMLVGLALAGMLVLLSATPPPGTTTGEGEAVATEDGALGALSEVKEVGMTSGSADVPGVVNEQVTEGRDSQLSAALIGPTPKDGMVAEEDGNILTEVVPMGIAEMFTGATFDAAHDDAIDCDALNDDYALVIMFGDECGAYPVPYLTGFIGDDNIPTEVVPLGIARGFDLIGTTFASAESLTHRTSLTNMDCNTCDWFTEVVPLGIAEGDLQDPLTRPPSIWVWLDPPELSLFLWLNPPSIIIYV